MILALLWPLSFGAWPRNPKGADNCYALATP
jgi:hypothetical protein